MVLFLFFCSGATALVYEVLWSKYLSLMFGSTVQAQTAVLTVFMGGLALGNALFGKRSAVLRSPLVAYGYMELGIAVYAFCFDWLYKFADVLFVRVGAPLLDHGHWLLLLKAALSVGLLLVPTVLMGGTLPTLAAWLQQRESESGRLSARFYSVNSLGAVFGSAVAGFYLIKTVGLVPTAQITALVNALVGAAAISIARRDTGIAISSSSEVNQPSVAPPLIRWAALLVSVTGGVSMGLEVVASRSLALIFGSSLQAFALVLIAFILGIGIGSSIIASPRWQRWIKPELVTILLLCAAGWTALLVFKIESWVEFYRWTKTGLAATPVGYLYHQCLIAFVAIVVLGIPAALIGAVLPLMIRTVTQGAKAIGAEVGRLLTWNTLGAVVGVVLTGFVLMPVLSLRNTFAVLALALCATAILHAIMRGQRPSVSVAVTIGVLLVFVTGTEQWKIVLSSGAFRSRETVYDPTVMAQRRAAVKIVYYKDAPDATVSVEYSSKSKELCLKVNGKADASARGDYSTQVLIGHLPLIVRPDAKDVFVLGLGSGISGGAVLAHPVEQLVIAENCEPVIEAARLFNEFNEGVLTNSRTRILEEDGRTVLKLSPQLYDVIISEPSNPWTAGIGSVFSREYYELAASRLKPGGLMAQWCHIYEIHDGIVLMLVRTFGQVFPHFEIWETSSGDIVLLGSKEPWKLDLENYRTVWQRDLVRSQMERIGLRTPEQLLARQLASQRTAFAIAGDGPIQSDYLPVLEYEAPKAFYMGIRAAALREYDERTQQMALMPKDKYNFLAALDDEALRPIFAEYDSANPELMTILRARLSGKPVEPNATSVFQRIDTSNGNTNAADGPIGRLTVALREVQTKPANTAELLAEIEQLVPQLTPSLPAQGLSVPHVAIVGASHSLATGNYAAARRFLDMGLKSDATHLKLQYLWRILEREQPDVALAATSR